MPITASQLRADVYNLLDQVIETGQPIEIRRKGRIVRLVVEEAPSKLSRLVGASDFAVGETDDFISMDWSALWSPELD